MCHMPICDSTKATARHGICCCFGDAFGRKHLLDLLVRLLLMHILDVGVLHGNGLVVEAQVSTSGSARPLFPLYNAYAT
jgi:hypothetical protein